MQLLIIAMLVVGLKLSWWWFAAAVGIVLLKVIFALATAK